MSSGTPVGMKDVVKMEYVIGYGVFDTGMSDWLAFDNSFEFGVSLSDIQWGFVNTGTQKGNEITGKITFTLHDIAGVLFQKYMHIKTGIDYIYFNGPKSDGSLWDGKDALFMVDADNCSLEFSATQGFTYTIAGISAFAVARTKQVAIAADAVITGVLGGDAKHFKKILTDDLTKTWNDKVDICKAGTAKIKIEFEDAPVGSYLERQPVTGDTKVEDPKAKNKPKTFQYNITRDTNLSDAITGLWNSIYQNDKDQANKVRVRVDFKEWKGDLVTAVVKFSDKTMDDALANHMKICVGDDVNCKCKDHDKNCDNSKIYRGELASISLNDMVNKFLIHEQVKVTENGNTITSGSSKGKTVKCTTTSRKYKNDYSSKTKGDMSWNASGLNPTGEGNRPGYWAQVYDLIQKNNVTPLEIEINMAYTFDFTPASHGGKLKDGLEGLISSIHITQGADFEFFWYEDENCAKLVKNPVISGKYRISEVNHQIGLGGNQTVVKLSHLQLGD